jgi:hypothetical protein
MFYSINYNSFLKDVLPFLTLGDLFFVASINNLAINANEKLFAVLSPNHLTDVVRVLRVPFQGIPRLLVLTHLL